jgi:hypothetical protein
MTTVAGAALYHYWLFSTVLGLAYFISFLTISALLLIRYPHETPGLSGQAQL